MRKLFLMFAIMLVAAPASFAQDYANWEFFIGYAHERANNGADRLDVRGRAINANGGETQDVILSDMTATTLGVDGVDVTANTTTADLDTIDAALNSVTTFRGQLGAAQNTFEHTINNLNVTVENLSASESRIRDTDMASEMVDFTRSQILSQAGTAMLAQANQSSQGVLRLLS